MSTPLRVLIIEDCEDSCVLIAGELQNHGYEPVYLRVDTAPAMRQALAEREWDVIIADYVVPAFDALASVKVARELVPDLPFIVVSGNLGEEVAVAVMKAGAQDYITKGNLTRLVPAIERELREADTRRARRQAEAALEAERRQGREALRKSQAGLLLAQRIGQLVSLELQITTRTMKWSAETCRIFDLAPEEEDPPFQKFLDLLADEDQLRVRQGFEKALHEGSSYRADCRIIRPDGSERSVHLQAQIILDQAEKPVQMIGTVQDITERKLLEEQLRQSQKMDAVGQLAGGIAHDFNNILTVIQGYAELIAYQPALDPQMRTYVNQIAVSAERASKLTRQLLAFSRKQLMQLKPLDLNSLLNELTAMLQGLLGEQSQLFLNLQANLPPVPADPAMLEQVLVNLVMNARDAMPKGGRLIIETSLHQIDTDYCRIHPEATPGQFICLGVVDTGCGIDATALPHIFEPFFTTKAVGRGTGLGLPTVYGIVKQHHGWIQVASQLGRGSAFKVFLPVAASTAAAVDRPIQGSLVGGGTETVLLVEDEPPLRKLARNILERFGYRVLDAGSGPEAMSVWKEHAREIDLLLTDLVMPGDMTGRELALRLQAERPALKVLYTSGYSMDFVESDLLLREGVNFVPKPYSGTSLGQAVRACLDRKN